MANQPQAKMGCSQSLSIYTCKLVCSIYNIRSIIPYQCLRLTLYWLWNILKDIHFQLILYLLAMQISSLSSVHVKQYNDLIIPFNIARNVINTAPTPHLMPIKTITPVLKWCPSSSLLQHPKAKTRHKHRWTNLHILPGQP